MSAIVTRAATIALGCACFATACGDDDVALPDAGTDAGALDAGPSDGGIVGIEVWVATDGDDANEGTETSPFATFGHGLAALGPGDTLVIADGDYPMTLEIDCSEGSTLCDGAPCANGLPGAPITVRSENERGAHIVTSLVGARIRSCAHWTLEGLHIEGTDTMGTSSGAGLLHVAGASHVTLRRNLVRHTNRYTNNHGVQLSASDHLLVEENEVYDVHRVSIYLIDVADSVIRRNYVNGRGVQDIPPPDGYTCCCERTTDDAIAVGSGYRVVIENNLIESACDGVELDSTTSRTSPPASRNHAIRVLGNAVRDADNAVFVRTLCEMEDPCPEDRIITEVEVVDLVAVASGRALIADVTRRSVFNHMTAVNVTGTVFEMRRGGENVGAAETSWVLMNSLDVGPSTVSFSVRDQDEFQIARTSSFGSATLNAYDAGSGATDQRQIDPALGACTVSIPDGSPMRGAGLGGGDIGANAVYRYRDGRLTDEPLWDPATFVFTGCGAVVAGVNDNAAFPDASCINAHERFGVGVACPLPY